MTDLTSLKAPGWQRVVAELTSPAPDDRAFILRLLSVLGQVSGARQAVFFIISGQREDEQAPPEAKPDLVWPLAVERNDPKSRAAAVAAAMVEGAPVNEGAIEHLASARAAASASAGSRQVRVFGLEGGAGGADQFYDGGGGQGCIVAVPVQAGLPGEAASLPLRGVITLFLDTRSRQALQTTLALVEVLAGFVFSHAAQTALRRTRTAVASLELAARLIASINNTQGFKACAMQLVNDLSRQMAVDRVAMGWSVGGGHARSAGGSPRVEGRRFVKAVAVSDTENIDRRMLMIQQLEAAMDECLDQEQPVMHPPPPEQGEGADAVLGRAITHAHRELASSDAKLKVASFPLRVTDKDGERVVGVVLIESSADGRIDLSTVELLQSSLDLVAPVLAVRRSDDRNLALRTMDSMLKAGGWLVGPTHTVWKLVGVLVLVASLVVTFVKTTYRVGAPMEIRAKDPRIVSVPFDGVLWTIAPGIESGKRVEQGQLLAELDTTQLNLALIEAKGQVFQYLKEMDEALKKPDLSAAAQAEAKSKQAQARVDLLEDRVNKAKITAPIAGTIISPDIREKLKASLKLGDQLFIVADLSRLEAVVKVEDRDIELVKLEQTGEISPKSDPARKIPIKVEQIVPLATPVEGVNSFEVRAAIVPGPGTTLEGLRPGLEGQARLNGPRERLIWIAGRRVIDQLRIWLWW